MTDLSESQLRAERERLAAMNDPQAIADLLRIDDPPAQLEQLIRDRLAEIDGGWLLDELGGVRRPLTAEQMDAAKEAFADMDSEAIVRELLAEQYFFHPDVLPLADARLAELENSGDI